MIVRDVSCPRQAARVSALSLKAELASHLGCENASGGDTGEDLLRDAGARGQEVPEGAGYYR